MLIRYNLFDCFNIADSVTALHTAISARNFSTSQTSLDPILCNAFKRRFTYIYQIDRAWTVPRLRSTRSKRCTLKADLITSPSSEGDFHAFPIPRFAALEVRSHEHSIFFLRKPPKTVRSCACTETAPRCWLPHEMPHAFASLFIPERRVQVMLPSLTTLFVCPLETALQWIRCGTYNKQA